MRKVRTKRLTLTRQTIRVLETLTMVHGGIDDNLTTHGPFCPTNPAYCPETTVCPVKPGVTQGCPIFTVAAPCTLTTF
jgi:hypothetical protein